MMLYHMAEVYLTQPIQIVAGSRAGSKWMSDDLYDRASSRDKRYHIVEGANHMDLYDGKVYVAEAISVLVCSLRKLCNETYSNP